MGNKFNLGVVGIGQWGKKLTRAFGEQAVIHSFYHSGSPENTSWMKKYFPDAQSSQSYESMLSDPKIDAVIIATPIPTHTELCKMALLAGKHVFVEKPLSTNTNDVLDLVKLSQEKNLSLFTGYIFLYSAALQKLKGELANKRITFAQFSWDKWGTFRDPISANFLSHELAIAIELLGEVISISQATKFGFVTNADMETYLANFASGASATFTINRVSPAKSKQVCFFTEDEQYIWSDNSLSVIHKDGAEERINFTDEESLPRECSAFLSSISDEQMRVTNITNSQLVTRALEMIDYLR